MTDQPTDLLHTVKEAGRLLSLSRSTVYREMDAGRLEYVLVGGSRRIPHTALLAYVDLLVAERKDQP